MEFRRLTTKDLDSTFACRLEALAYDGNEKASFGAIDQNKVVGTIGIMFGDKPRDSHKATIWGMFVSPKYRGTGAGGKLLDLAIEFAAAMRENGVDYDEDHMVLRL